MMHVSTPSILTAEARAYIAEGHKDFKLAKLLSNDRVTITRDHARRMIEAYHAEQLITTLKVVPSNKHHAESREEWFMRAQAAAEPVFAKAGYPLPPKIRIGCGWPSGGKRSHALGEAWPSGVSGDTTYEIFINPRMSTAILQGDMVDKDHPMFAEGDLQVLCTVWHEFVHCALWHAGYDKHKHGAEFKALAADIGQEIKNRKGGTAWLPEYIKQAQAVLDEIGPYPMAPMLGMTSAKPTQTTRMLLIVDPDNEKYKLRMSRETITVFKLPFSPAKKLMVIDPMSALKSEYISEALVAEGLAIADEKGKLTITTAGHDRAMEIIDDILSSGE